jgi:hypothetical protein
LFSLGGNDRRLRGSKLCAGDVQICVKVQSDGIEFVQSELGRWPFVSVQKGT